MSGDELGAARVARLREALEAIEASAQRADRSVFAVESGTVVCPVRFLEQIADIARDALSDDDLTRERPTASDIRVSVDAAVSIDHSLARGHRGCP